MVTKYKTPNPSMQGAVNEESYNPFFWIIPEKGLSPSKAWPFPQHTLLAATLADKAKHEDFLSQKLSKEEEAIRKEEAKAVERERAIREVEEIRAKINKHDAVNHPKHYTSHPSGVECITITEHYNFCVGNAIKYLWRAGLKDAEVSTKEIEDCKKAIWYIQRQIQNLEKKNASS